MRALLIAAVGAVAAGAVGAGAGCHGDWRQAGSYDNHPLVPALPPAYDAALPAWPPAVPAARIGRGVAPTRAVPVAITAAAGEAPRQPLVVTAVHAVPVGPEAPAVAIASGVIGDAPVIEAIGVDDGVVRWRDQTRCMAPVVHVTSSVVVCAGATGVAALDVATGVERWRLEELTYVGAQGDLVLAVLPPARAVVVRADDGEALAAADVPPTVVPGELRVACAQGAGFEVWAWSSAQLQRFAIGGGADATAVASMLLPRAPARVEPCEEPALVELPIPGSVERELYALRREPLGFADGAVIERGFWRRDLGEVGVATARGIEVRDVTLGEVAVLSDAQVGRELASRGTRRLVRGAAGVPVLLDRDVPVAYLSAPTHPLHAALGDTHVLGGSWLPPARSQADRVERFHLPPPALAPAVPPVVAPAPPRPPLDRPDLPAEMPAPASIDLPGAAMHDVGAVLLDPADPTRLYVAVLEARPDASRGAGVAAFDLAARAWLWHAPDGCPAGQPVALAAARDVVVCGARGALPGAGRVRAIARADGATRWTWAGQTVDAVVAGGGVAAVVVGRRAWLLDAATGARLGAVRADDGFAPRFVLAEVAGDDVVVAVERGVIAARAVRAGMLPLWAVAVDGTVVALGRAGGRVTAELSTGELYLLEPGDGAAVAAAGWARRWRLLGPGDVVAIEDVEPPATAPTWRVEAFGVDGAPRFAVELVLEPPWQLGPRGAAAGAPVVAAYGPASRFAAVLDPWRGRVQARVALPDRAAPGAVFSSAIDGAPVAGAVLRQPLGVVLF